MVTTFLFVLTGYWPLGVTWCNVYVTCDVLACSASILHMCCISLGRYLGIRSPIKARRGGLGGYNIVAGGGSKRLVAVRVVLVWLLALLISSPISALGLIDSANIMNGDQCVINHRGFAFFGSLAAFILPMIIMVVSYALTVHLLRNKARQHQQQLVNRAPGGGGNGSGGGRTNAPRQDDLTAELQLVQERGTQTPACVSRERRKLVWKARMSPFASNGRRSASKRTPRDVEGGVGGSDDDDDQRRQPIRIIRASRSRKISSNSNGGGSGVVATMTPNISSAATVANEQKASKVLGVVFFT